MPAASAIILSIIYRPGVVALNVPRQVGVPRALLGSKFKVCPNVPECAVDLWLHVPSGFIQKLEIYR